MTDWFAVTCEVCGTPVRDQAKHQAFHDSITWILHELRPDLVDEETITAVTERLVAHVDQVDVRRR